MLISECVLRPITTDVLLLPEDGREATNLCTKSGTDMLRGIVDKCLDCFQDLTQHKLSGYQGAEARNLACYGRPHLSLVVLEQLHKSRDHVSGQNFLIHSFGNLWSS